MERIPHATGGEFRVSPGRIDRGCRGPAPGLESADVPIRAARSAAAALATLAALATAGVALPDGAPAPAWRHEELAGDVYYQVFVRSFADSDGDGVGDLAGLTERLDYLDDGDPATGGDLGVDG